MADQIEQMGVTLENQQKGKARAVDDDEITPTERARSDKGFLEDFKLISRFQEGFVDRRPEVNTSRVADQTKGSNHSSNQAGSSDQTEGDEATNQMQVTIHEGAIDPTPLPRENEEPRRVDEENNTLYILRRMLKFPEMTCRCISRGHVMHALWEINKLKEMPLSSQRDQPSSPAPRQRMTKMAEGIEVSYETYEEGSGKRFAGCNIPPNLKNKLNMERQEYQMKRNHASSKQIILSSVMRKNH
nr:ribosomal RNA processing protein 36 homolog [Ipomoea batatas]